MNYPVVSSKLILTELIKNKGRVAKTARVLGITSASIRRRMEKNPAIAEAYEMFLDEIVDDAMEGMRGLIHMGDASMIKFALERLGGKRGFKKEASKMIHEGSLENPIQVQQNFNLEGLSMEEKESIMRIAKRKMDEGKDDVKLIDLEAISDGVFENKNLMDKEG